MARLFFIFFMATSLFAQSEIYASFDVMPKNRAKLALSTVGIVQNINVEIGDIVKKDDILLEVEKRSENIALENAKNSYELSKTAENFSLNTLNRFKKLKSAVSKQEFDRVSFEYDKAVLQRKQSEIGVENAKELISKKSLKAPFNAIVVGKYIEVGEGVASPTQPLIEVYSYPEVKLLLSFDGKFADTVKVGDTFKYRVDNSDEELIGKIALIYPQIDLQTRKIYAEVYTKGLKPGLFGEGKILVK